LPQHHRPPHLISPDSTLVLGGLPTSMQSRKASGASCRMALVHSMEILARLSPLAGLNSENPTQPPPAWVVVRHFPCPIGPQSGRLRAAC
jgi:hypothetical protein